MPAHNYMLEDVLGVLRAVAIFPLFVVAPGYVAAWFGNLLGFRGRTLRFRLAISTILSISICPILTFATGRFISMTAVWALYATAAVASLVLLVRDRHRFFRARPNGAVIAILTGWLLLCLWATIDLQTGSRIYLPTGSIDHALRGALVHSISLTGVPPVNPFFEAGHAAPLRYHYFWLLMCSLVERAAGVLARHAIAGGIYWIGVGLIALLAVSLRTFVKAPKLRLTTGVALLAITGLDIVPALFFMFLYGRGMLPFVMPSVELWNEHVEWFLATAINTPHAIASLISCWTALLLLWERRGRVEVAFAALALASAVGDSLYVAFVFALFLMLWTCYLAARREFAQAVRYCVAGTGAVLLLFPYLHDLAGQGQGGPLFSFTVREFSLAALVPTGSLPAIWRRILVNGALLPINYFLEFGLFFLTARYKWQQHRRTGRPLPPEDIAMGLMAAVSTLVCTFLRSSVIGNNDLGWRGFLVAQFVLLLWAVDLFGGREENALLTGRQKQALAVCFALGFAGTVTDQVLMRAYPVLADRGVVPPLDWMSPDRDFGRRAYAARTAYDWVRTATPASVPVQANPRSTYQDTLGMTYGERPTVAADRTCFTTFGGDPAKCAPVAARVDAVFDRAAVSDLRDACSALPLDVVVVKDIDAAWRNAQSWVWSERPEYANRYVRVFRCGAGRE